MSSMPIISIMWLRTIITNIALPLRLNFVREITIIISSLVISKTILILLMVSCFQLEYTDYRYLWWLDTIIYTEQ